MENFKYFNMIVQGNKLTMTTFKAKNADKDDFVDEFTMYLFLNWFDKRCSIVYVLIREMFKNVFDHGTGEATLNLVRDGDNYSFEFIDHNTKIISFDKCCQVNRGKDWVQKSSSNRNFGMSLIQTLKNEKGVILEIDDTRGGINYFGSYTS